ncbi:MAG: DUF5069 domain-containing protein [Nitrospina sp.]|jgi:hypothetical protein|nr:DUF5069 domain-containing protein [Nitrospina sp.]
MNNVNLNSLAKDLNKEPPSSPREMLGGYVILARCVDKCRSFLAGKNGEYNYWPCSLCEALEAFSGVDHVYMKDFIATGASDEEVAEWFKDHSKVKSEIEKIRWNNKMRDLRICDMSDQAQEFLENYIQENVPKHRPAYVWFDVFDLEEERL